ncbi:adenosine deaminase [Intrasporangium oryzae NRRL B-24470]|uniref:Adenosine deaminase n=1 Tax=Intrasporangium oryzae NRRL B-24470 TaxID=1386089 RepID=W9GDX1_9MICO|nr:adenosine deaminase [Intrasporangium oryzae]EWT02993.1 adenosine deaminase [Intrasporangium oryzae NRRL B-24470]
MTRSVQDLPKAHLHLHFTGSMRVETVRDLAVHHGIRLPDALLTAWPPHLARATDERGWFRFQRLYDAARACVRGESDMRRVVREAALDDAAEGSRWLEIQVDPTSYAPFVGGITPALEIVLDEARAVSASGRIGVAVVVAASRMRHPLEARTLARLAARYAGDDAGTVVGFGLSNDERRGVTEEYAPAFAIARRAGLALVPHGGELLGAQSVMETLEHLAPDRIGHGVRCVEDPQVLDAVAEAGVTLEVCPGSNVALGVYAAAAEVPLRRLVDAGIGIALGADDPLLFGSRLAAQYAAARDLGFDDAGLAAFATSSLTASRAPEHVRKAAVADIETWLTTT